MQPSWPHCACEPWRTVSNCLWLTLSVCLIVNVIPHHNVPYHWAAQNSRVQVVYLGHVSYDSWWKIRDSSRKSPWKKKLENNQVTILNFIVINYLPCNLFIIRVKDSLGCINKWRKRRSLTQLWFTIHFYKNVWVLTQKILLMN